MAYHRLFEMGKYYLTFLLNVIRHAELLHSSPKQQHLVYMLQLKNSWGPLLPESRSNVQLSRVLGF